MFWLTVKQRTVKEMGKKNQQKTKSKIKDIKINVLQYNDFRSKIFLLSSL